VQTTGDHEQDMTQSNFPPSNEPSATPWRVVSDNVPPPPPVPPFGHGAAPWQWELPSHQPSHRGRRALAAALAAIFIVGIGSGVAVARLTGTGTAPAVALTPAPLGGTGTGTGNGSGNGVAPGTGTGGGTVDPSAATAKVTPGIVNINVTLSGNGGAAGTGMIITSTGEVLTNNHVVDGETSLTIQLPSTGKTYSGHVLGYDLTDDVALVQIDGGGTFQTVSIGNSSNVAIGDAVVALGNALGRNGLPSVTTGQVTALDRTITASDQSGADVETVSGLIQVDAQIQPGDSGGPLTTADGTVIGMNTAAQSAGRSNQGSTVAYAIPINNAITIVKQIQSGKSTSTVHVGDTRALLGVGAQDTQNGVKVVQVQAGSAAANAGIAVGSTITSLDGATVDSNATLRHLIVAHNPGESVSVAWTDSAGNAHTATVTLGSGPPG
jgi:S1-C subfamily serine protease